MGKKSIFSIFVCSVFWGYLFQGCIKNDLPYPKAQAAIEEMEVEGLAQTATINKNYNTVLLLVDDTIDLREIRITRMEVTAGTTIIPDKEACYDASLFPDSGFVHVDSLQGNINTKINLRNPANFTLRIYDDFPWEITAEHYLNRKYNLREAFQVTDAEGNAIQVGQPRVDESNKNIVIYVDDNADLSNLRVQKMQIGSSVAVTRPEPTSITDFRRPVSFEVTAFDETEVWTITITYSLESNLTITPWSRRAYIMGDANENSTIDIRFRRQGDEIWDMVYSDEITFEDGSFTALVRHLQPNTVYEYEATVGNTVYDLAEFTTDDIPELPNAGFENWSLSDKGVWLAHGADEDMFWDSGNHGSMTVEKNVTNYDESIYRSGRRSAKLASEFVVLKFAAGNLFAGQYMETLGSDGLLNFGRPFTVRPTALEGWFRYVSAAITNVSSDDPIEDAQLGMPDKGHIYVAVGDWDSPVRICTRKADRELFDVNDEHIIAYQELIIEESVTQWTPFRLNFDYRSFTRKPTYLVIVATASKYGDYFTGGAGSTLWLDDFELVYE